MFIPKGKAVHENLATRYVLIEALVADLCESDFSGVVEISLPGRDSHIIIDSGKVGVVVEQQGAAGGSKTSLSSLAKRASAERGTVSVYRYPPSVAGSIAGRFAAQPLYTNLSTDFADLEKLVLKLLRENDREWFVEVFTGGNETLIHIADEQYRIISSDTLSEKLTNPSVEKPDAALSDLVEACQRGGGTFDVYFRPARREDETPVESPLESPRLESLDEPVLDERILESENPIEEALLPAPVGDDLAPAIEADDNAEETGSTETMSETSIAEETDLATQIANSANPIEISDDFFALPESAPETLAIETGGEVESPVASQAPARPAARESVNSSLPHRTAVAAVNEPEAQDLPPRVLPTRELMALPSNFEGLEEAMKMADIRRLLGKIIKTIEEVNRAVEQKDNFQIHLRAGQLKVADLYPFLDPFGSEFEYLDGEVVFIGKIESEEFVSGLTDALIYAVTEAAQASPQPMRLRSVIAEELKNLLNRHRDDFARYELDVSIKRIIGPQMWQSFSEIL